MAKKATSAPEKSLTDLFADANQGLETIKQEQITSTDYGDSGLTTHVEGIDSKFFEDRKFSPDFYAKEGQFAEYKAQQQDALDKFANTTGKWAGIAGTTFLSTFTSLPIGILEAAASGDVSKVWDNEAARYLNSINKDLEELLPHYETQKEKAADWYDPDYWFTTNFLTNTILKNTGYLVGTQWAMKGVSSSLYNLAKGISSDYAAATAKYAQLIESGMSATEAAKKVGGLVNKIDAGIKGATVTMSALGEGSMEALGAAEEFEKDQIAKYMEVNGLTDENQVPAYIHEQIKDRAKSVGNTTLALNLPLLMGQDLLLFGKSIKQGYKAEKKLLGSITGDGMAAEFKATPINKGIERAKALSKPLYEGFEEGAQYASAEGSKDFYDLRNDQDEKNNVWDFLASIGNGIEKTFSTKEGITSMISGGITGYLPGAVTGQIGKELSDINKIDANTQDAVDALNKYSTKETFKNRAESIVRGQAIENQKQEALANKDEFAYKNAELDGLKNMYLAYKNADKLDLLKEQLADAKKLSPAEFAETFTASEDMFKDKSVAEHISSIEKQIEEFEAIKDNVELLFSNPKGPSAEVAFSASADIQDSQNRQNSLKQEINKAINEDAKSRAHLVDIFDGGDIKTANQTIDSILNKVENPLVAKTLKPKMQDWYNLEVRKQQAIAKLKGLETAEQQEKFDNAKRTQTETADKTAADNAKTKQKETETKSKKAKVDAQLNAKPDVGSDLGNEDFGVSPEQEFNQSQATDVDSLVKGLGQKEKQDQTQSQPTKQDPSQNITEIAKRALEAARFKKTSAEVLKLWHGIPQTDRQAVQDEFKKILESLEGLEPEALPTKTEPKQEQKAESVATLLHSGMLNKMYSNSYSINGEELNTLIKNTTPAEFIKNATVKFEKHNRKIQIINGTLTPSIDAKIFYKGKLVGFFPYSDIVPVNSTNPAAGSVKLESQSASWLVGNRITDSASAEQMLQEAKGLSGIYNYVDVNNLYDKEISLDSLSNMLGVHFTNGQINLLTNFKYNTTEIDGTNIDGTYYVIDRGEEEDGGSLIDASIKDLKDYYKTTFNKNLEDVLKETYGSDDLFKACPKLGRYVTISILPNGVVTFVASRPAVMSSEDVQKEINSILEVRTKAVDTEVTNDKGEKSIQKLIPTDELDKINKKSKPFFITDGSGTAKNPSGFTITLRIASSGKLYFDYNNRKAGERSKRVYVSNPNATSLKDILTSANQSIDTNKLGLPKITEQSFRASISPKATNQETAQSLITAVDKTVRSAPSVKFVYNTPVIEQEMSKIKSEPTLTEQPKSKNTYEIVEDDDFGTEPSVEESTKVVNETVRDLNQINKELEVAKNNKDIEAIKRLTAEKVALNNKLDGSDTPKVRKNKGGTSFKLNEKLSGVDQGTEISFEEAKNILKNMLPEGISVEILDKVINGLKTDNVQGAYSVMDKILYLKERTTDKVAYHEAFHAVFETVLTDEEISRVLSAAKAIYGVPHVTTLQAFAIDNKITRLSRKEQLDRWYNEKMAEDFEKKVSGKPNSKLKNTIIGKIFDKINSIVDWFKDIFAGTTINRDKRIISSLFDGITTGKYKSYKPAKNRFTKDNVSFKLIKSGYIVDEEGTYPKYLPLVEGKKVVSTIAAKLYNAVRQKESSEKSKYDGWITEAILDDIIANELEFNSLDNETNSTLLSTLEGKKFDEFIDTLTDLSFVYSNPESIATIKAEVKEIYKAINFNAEEKEDQEDRTIDEKGEKWGEESWSKGGFGELSKAIRQYIAFTTYETTDEFGRTYTTAVDVNRVYNGLTRALAGTRGNDMLNKFEQHAEWNEEASKVWEKLKADTGLIKSEEGIWKATIDENLLNGFITSFNREFVEYTATLFDPSNGKFEVFNANTFDVDKQQVDKWSNNYIALQSDMESGNKPELKSKIVNVFKNLNDTLNSKKKLNKLQLKQEVETIKKDLDFVGITLSPGYIAWSIVANRPEENRTKEQQEFYLSYINDVQPINFISGSKSTTIVLSEIISKGNNPFEGSKETDAKDEGARGRMLKLAKYNSIFDETVGSSSFQNANNKQVFDKIYGSHVIEATKELRDSNKIKELLKDKFLKNNILLNSPVALELFKDARIKLIDGIRQTSLGNNEVISKEGEGLTYGDFDPRSYALQNLIMFSNQKDIKDQEGNLLGKATLYNFRQLEASSTGYAMELPVETYYDSKGMTSKALSQLMNNFVTEFDRIGRVFKEIETGKNLIKDYHTPNKKGIVRGLEFWNFSFLKTSLTEEQYTEVINVASRSEGIEKVSEETKQAIKDAIKTNFDNELQNYKDKLLQLGVLKTQDKTGNIINNLLPGVKETSKGLYDPKYKGNINTFLGDFYLNDLINSWAFNEILDGDYAEGRKDPVDAVKRHKGSMASGPSLGDGQHTVAYIEDPQAFIDPNDPELKDIEGGSKIDIADAQSWISLSHKRLQMLRWGKLTPKVASIYDKIENGEEITWEDKVYLEKQGAALNSGKTVTFDGKHYHKLSEITLTKRIVAYKDVDGQWKALPGKELLFDVYNQMNNPTSPIDQVIAASGSKLATKVPSKLVDGKYDLSSSATVIENRYKRLQVETPSGKLKITAGTQFMQLIDSELDETLEVEFNGEQTTLGKLREQYQSLLANVRDNALEDLIGQVFDNNTQTVKLTKAAKKFLETVEASGADDNMIEFFSLNANGEPKYDYNLVNIIDKFEQLFLAHFNKEGFSQKRAGLKVSLVSGHGYKIARDINGNVVSARDIQNDPTVINRISKNEDGSYVTTELRYNVKDSDGKYYSECVIPAWLKKMYNLEKGDIIPDQALKMIGYRIPTQDKHSMMALKVVDFLPAEYGSVGIFPKQIVYLSGADFDIDSEFIQRALQYFKTNSEGKTEWKFFGNAKTDEERFEEYLAYNDKYNKDVTKLIENLKENSVQYQKDLVTAKNIKVWLKNYVKPVIDSKWSNIKEYHKAISELENILETGVIPEDVNIESLKEQLYNLQVKLSTTYDDLDKYARSVESYKNEAMLKDYDPNAEAGMNLKEFLDLMKEAEAYFRTSAFKELGLATTQEEFNALPESKKETKGSIDNKLLKLELEFLTNEGIRQEVAITPAGVDRMEDVAKYISNLTKDTPHEVSIEDKSNVHGALGKLNANTKNAVGKENIGPAAIANVIHSMLSKTKVTLKTAALKFNGVELTGYGLNTKDGKILDLDGDRVNDNISSVLSQMTDEAKNPLSELLNLPIDILGGICNALAQGLPLKTAMLFSSQPLLRQYANKLAVNKYAIKTRDEDVYKKQVINDLLKEITDIIGEETVSKIEDLNLTTSELEAALSSKEYDTDFYITQYKVLSQYQKLEDQTSNYFNKIKFITSALTKGLPSSITEMAKFDSAIKELGLEGIAKGEETLSNQKQWSELNPEIPFDIREAVLKHKLTLSNLKNYYKISRTLVPKFFITETSVGKRIWSILKDNLKASLQESVLNSYKKDLLSYMSIQAYKKHLKDTNQEDILATINSNLLNSTKTLADRLIKIKSDDRYKNNKLINYLVATLQTDKNNKTGIGLVSGRIRVKENPQYVSELIDAYQELYNDPLTHQFANDLFNYLIVKDGLQFRTNSFVKYISPFMFREISKSNKKITSALSDLEGFKNQETFESVFGTNPTNFLYSFLEATLRHSENQMDTIYFRDNSKIQSKTTEDKATMAIFRTEEVRPDKNITKRIIFNIFQATEKDPETNKLSEKGREQFKTNVKALSDFGLNSKSEKYTTKEGEEKTKVQFEFPLYINVRGEGLFKLSVLDKETYEGNFIESGPTLDESETIPSGTKAVYIKVSTLGNKAVKSVGLELEDLVGLTNRMRETKVAPKQQSTQSELSGSEYGLNPEQEFATELGDLKINQLEQSKQPTTKSNGYEIVDKDLDNEDFSNMNTGMLDREDNDLSSADLNGNTTSLEDRKKEGVKLFPEHSEIINNAKSHEDLNTIIKKYCK